MKYLIVGGSSGLGLELGKLLSETGSKVIILGRHDPGFENLEYHELDLSVPHLSESIDKLVKNLPKIDGLIYAAGYYQEGRVTDLSDTQIEEMINVCGLGLVYFVKSLLKKQNELAELITITSTSQWTPRALEPIYNFAKAGAGHFSNSMAEDGRVGKVLVAGPAGMRTNFWKDVGQTDLAAMNDPADVARIILDNLTGDFKYKMLRILRQPLRSEITESR